MLIMLAESQSLRRKLVRAINNRPRNNDSACFSPRSHHPSGQERRPARPPQDPAQRAELQGEIAKADRHAFTGQK
jgi:hypothetical protein